VLLRDGDGIPKENMYSFLMVSGSSPLHANVNLPQFARDNIVGLLGRILDYIQLPTGTPIDCILAEDFLLVRPSKLVSSAQEKPLVP